jgi:hypothetical protein
MVLPESFDYRRIWCLLVGFQPFDQAMLLYIVTLRHAAGPPEVPEHPDTMRFLEVLI